ncbi:MAG: NAD(+)/NADH kinase [Rikenellaceae bacterium]
MKILIFTNINAAQQFAELSQIITEIELRSYTYAINREVAELVGQMLPEGLDESMIYGDDVGDQPEDTMMICYGGDGTMLSGLHRLGGRAIAVAGINSGRMGFLTTASKCRIAELFDAIEGGDITVERRSMIAARGEFSSGEWLYGVNEVAVHRHGASMIEVRCSVDQEPVATYHGDGVVVATPTGSTAYSLSAGGPVVAPGCACWLITPLAPHNITMRPLAIPDSSKIELNVEIRIGDAAITLDDRTYIIDHGMRVELQRAERSFYLVRPAKQSFYSTLRDKMMWGVDLRTK